MPQFLLMLTLLRVSMKTMPWVHHVYNAHPDRRMHVMPNSAQTIRDDTISGLLDYQVTFLGLGNTWNNKGEPLESAAINALFALKRVGKCTCRHSHYRAWLELHSDEKQNICGVDRFPLLEYLSLHTASPTFVFIFQSLFFTIPVSPRPG